MGRRSFGGGKGEQYLASHYSKFEYPTYAKADGGMVEWLSQLCITTYYQVESLRRSIWSEIGPTWLSMKKRSITRFVRE